MNFPSLLFENKIKTKSISNEVFSDLKITGILSDYACNILSFIPTDSECKSRADIFKALENSSELRAYAKKVSDKAQICAKLKNAYTMSYLPLSRAFLCAEMWSEIYGLMCIIVDTDLPLPSLMQSVKDKIEEMLAEKDVNAMLKYACKASEQAQLPKYMLTIYDKHFEYAPYTEGESMLGAVNECCKTDFKSVVYDSEYEELCEKLLCLDEDTLEFSKDFYEKYQGENCEGLNDFSHQLNLLFELIDLYENAEKIGINHTYPTYNMIGKVTALDVYDITLIAKGEQNIVPNDIFLTDDSHFAFLCGANGGGKTTYLRAVGFNIILAVCGFPVFAQSMDLCRFDGIFTHFPHDENFQGEGRFANEKRRIAEMKDHFGKLPFVLLNETYSTTTEEKSATETNALADEFNKDGIYGIYVTHASGIVADGVAKLEVAIDKDDDNKRTYKVVKSDKKAPSYAEDILKKYGLDKASLTKKYGGAR